MRFNPKNIGTICQPTSPQRNCPTTQAHNTFKSSLAKAAAYTTGIIVACASLYSLTEFTRKTFTYFDSKQAENRFITELQNDPRFENGYTVTKFCFEKTYGDTQWEK
jgi:hypothetical protein